MGDLSILFFRGKSLSLKLAEFSVFNSSFVIFGIELEASGIIGKCGVQISSLPVKISACDQRFGLDFQTL